MKAKDKLNEYCRLDINQLTHKDLNTYSLKLSTIIEAMEEYAQSQLQALKEGELLTKYSRLEHCVRAYKEASEEFDDATNGDDHKAIDKAMINLYERKEQMYEALKNVENLTTNLDK